MPTPSDCFIHLRHAGVSLLVEVTNGQLPAIAHWGADLGELSAADAATVVRAGVHPIVPNLVDQPVRVAVLPEHWTGWVGRPGLAGSRAGRGWSPRFAVTEIRVDGRPVSEPLVEAGAALIEVDAADPSAGLAITVRIGLAAGGLVRTQATLTNTADDGYSLDSLVLALPVPPAAKELLDLAGRWGRERSPQRLDFVVGTHLREGRKGRTGPDAATVLHAGTPGFSFGGGEVWGVHVGWSGNHVHYAERLSTGEQVLGGGELLLPGEVILAVGAEYTTPWLYGAYGTGLDGVARSFHRYLRSRPQHPSAQRPVTLNVWEAVYFDHDLGALTELAEIAAGLGVERYVLDDGWFGSRRDDHSGLGDWQVSPQVWPDGLHPLIAAVRSRGMQFGLWVEPEMVNPDSEVARAHPEWVMTADPQRWPVESRFQQVINLGIPECYAYIRDALLAILDEYDIDYLKWDHNRDLIEAGTQPSGRPGVHEQTLAFYRLLDELKAAHPGLEIESCSSGGARVDLGVLERTDRVWVSDCIDPHERQLMHRWTTQLIPPELMGSHIASRSSHTTGRVHDLNFRAATALFGHLGIEWDLRQATPAERASLGAWIALYKDLRDLLNGGDLVRIDLAEPSLMAAGVIAPDRSRAIYSFAAVDRPHTALIGRLPLPGLDPDRRYRVSPLMLAHPPGGLRPPLWWGVERDLSHELDDLAHGLPPTLQATGSLGVELSGRALGTVGLTHAPTNPDQAVLYLAEALD